MEPVQNWGDDPANDALIPATGSVEITSDAGDRITVTRVDWEHTYKHQNYRLADPWVDPTPPAPEPATKPVAPAPAEVST